MRNMRPPHLVHVEDPCVPRPAPALLLLGHVVHEVGVRLPVVIIVVPGPRDYGRHLILL